MNIQKAAKAIELGNRSAKPDEPTIEKFKAAVFGAGITLFLTLLVTSLQFLLFSFPSELFSKLDQIRHFNVDFGAEVALQERFSKDLGRVAEREGRRELRFLRIRSLNDVQSEQVLDGKLGTLQEILEDKGAMEGYEGEGGHIGPTAFMMIRSLEKEADIWNFMLESNAKDAPEIFKRQSIEVVESTHRNQASAELWRDNLTTRVQTRTLELETFNEQLGILWFKATIAILFLLMSGLIGLFYGERLASTIVQGGWPTHLRGRWPTRPRVPRP
jgi:hypothetical protein